MNNAAAHDTPVVPHASPLTDRPLLRAFAWGATLLLLPALIIAPATLQQQLVLTGVLFVSALFINRVQGRMATLVLIFLSVVVSSRYIYWRVTETMYMDTALDLVLGIGLLMAEVYAFVVLLLGYMQTAWPLERKPVPLPMDPSTWPTIDIFIPTYDESLSVVRSTVLAAQLLDWPPDKIAIYVLDDGRREEFRVFCKAVGVTHITRADNKHAKAGNINAALKLTKGEYVAVFDCDHIPTRCRRRSYRAQDAPGRLQHRVPCTAAGCGLGDRKPVEPCGPAHSLGTGYDADFSCRQSAFRARTQLAAKVLLCQRHDALPLRIAPADLSHSTARVPVFRRQHHPCVCLNDLCLRAPARGPCQFHQQPGSGAFPTLVLE